LVSVRERIVVDERPIPTDAFVAWTAALEPTIEAAGASFFEATTAIAFADFAARQVDVAVVEVGLGGRLDATNILSPAASAVTNVALEHTEYLGTSLHAIAREKAGIAKPGVPFVVGETDPAVRSSLVEAAMAVGSTPVLVAPDRVYQGRLALTGRHQRRNAAVAEAVLAALPPGLAPSPEAVCRGFALATVPGRFDRRGRWLFDVAHNPHGMETLVAAMAEHDLPRPRHALVAILSDKNWPEMLGRLRGAVDHLLVTIAPTAPIERRWSLEAVQERFPEFTVEPDFALALAAVAEGAGTIVVTGSFHTVGDALARLPGFAPLG
jgi:dihydrofolate synthase/folylpolyglutamate synthase